jgi:hypothetical protein
MAIKDKYIEFEVALEILGQSQAPLVDAIHNERNKPQPSELKIKYLLDKIASIQNLMEEIMPDDVELVAEIMNKDNLIYRGV